MHGGVWAGTTLSSVSFNQKHMVTNLLIYYILSFQKLSIILNKKVVPNNNFKFGSERVKWPKKHVRICKKNHYFSLCKLFANLLTEYQRVWIENEFLCFRAQSGSKLSVKVINKLSVFTAPDKKHKINFSRHYLHYFFTKSYVWPLVRIVSMRRF